MQGDSAEDEPITYLDIRYQIEILQLVKKLNQEFGITIIMVLHDINQAIAYSDNVIGMKEGKIICDSPPQAFAWELFEKHNSDKRSLPQIG